MLTERSLPTARGVPFLDLRPSHAGLREAILDDFGELIDSGAFTNGPAVSAFEEEFARYCGVAECVGVASGLDALRLALLALGIAPGDEVIVPAATFIATFEAVTQAGGTPVPVDVDGDYGLDLAAAEAAVTERTRFVLPVHLYGQMVDVEALARFAEKHNLIVLEDACQAHGAVRAGIRAGAAGDAAAFSFYPGKNLGAMGDAGALVTDDADLAARIRALREHGQTAKYRHGFIGFTSRLDTVHATALLHKLPLLDGWNEERRAIAARYEQGLAHLDRIVLPSVAAGSEPVWHLYVIRTKDPQALGAFLHERAIGTGRHYPDPPHLTDAYAPLGFGPGSFPAAEALSAEALSLPMFPGMTTDQADVVIAAVDEYCRLA